MFLFRQVLRCNVLRVGMPVNKLLFKTTLKAVHSNSGSSDNVYILFSVMLRLPVLLSKKNIFRRNVVFTTEHEKENRNFHLLNSRYSMRMDVLSRDIKRYFLGESYSGIVRPRALFTVHLTTTLAYWIAQQQNVELGHGLPESSL
ncbi:hypothetical protein T265_11675 [Opisthorchis viverrini]|uniref:Uncharacterized protein n=1 Tax=Opisthorchis viverrini TaxID=6198 RepID=A0A074Z274_OPIVI|nr:hypothetical protein T265_11675 [Opisthorchis viverrini]KER19602.1 hypothetical protein T265_11675 [Opisthorchis viverrini]